MGIAVLRPGTFPPTHTPTPLATGLSLPARGGQGLWPGWMDVCLALERSQSPLPWRDHHPQPCLGPLGKLAMVPSLSCPNLLNFRCTSYQQGVWILGTLARTTANESARKCHLPWGSRRPLCPPPPFPSGLWVTLCVHRLPYHTPAQMERGGQGMGPAG